MTRKASQKNSNAGKQSSNPRTGFSLLFLSSSGEYRWKNGAKNGTEVKGF